MFVYLLCWVLMLGGVLVAPAGKNDATKPKSNTNPVSAPPEPKKKSKLASLFRAVSKFFSLLRNVGRFIQLVRNKVVAATQPAKHAVQKLKSFGKKIYVIITKLLEYLKPWENNFLLGPLARPIVKHLSRVKYVIDKINHFFGGKMTAADKKELGKDLLCCGNKCPCDPLEESPPAKGFLGKLKETAKKMIKKIG